MANRTIRLTMAQAIVRYLVNQYTEIDGARVSAFCRRVRYFWTWQCDLSCRSAGGGARSGYRHGGDRMNNPWHWQRLPMPRQRKDARLW